MPTNLHYIFDSPAPQSPTKPLQDLIVLKKNAAHCRRRVKAVGQRLHYVATDAQGQWLALLVFSAPAKHLKHRDRWIGWSSAQRHRRLSLVTNNSRFLILPGRSVPNLASKVLRLTLDRLPADWQSSYGHPVLVVETFVDVAQFCGTLYSARGWGGRGQTDGAIFS